MEYTTNNMTHEQLHDKNNIIYVTYKDTIDKLTTSRKKEIERVIQKKYGCEKIPRVKMVPIIYTNNGFNNLKRADASTSVSDLTIQRSLIDQYLKDNNLSPDMNILMELDANVNAHKDITTYIGQLENYKRFNIKKIEFSNFLSYGDNNVISFDDKFGITTITSVPANQGGKTILSIDLIMFLFFGSSINDRIKELKDAFNLYRPECNVLVVKGTIEVDGEIYILRRRLVRKEAGAKPEQTVEFYRKSDNGRVDIAQGSNVKEEIKKYFGTKEDFETTILATGDNLNDLITTRPAERGKLLTRFIGVDLFDKKMTVAKEMYVSWKKGSKLHTTDSAKFNNDIKEQEVAKQNNEEMLLNKQTEFTTIKTEIENLNNERDILSKKLHNDVDKELYQVDEVTCRENIAKHKKNETEHKLKVANLRKSHAPTPEREINAEFTDIYGTKIGQRNTINNKYIALETQITLLKEKINELKNSEFCPTCGTKLDNVNHADEIIKQEGILLKYETNLNVYNKDLDKLNEQIAKMDAIKSQETAFNTSKLILEKGIRELEKVQKDLTEEETKLSKYTINKQMINDNQKTETAINVIDEKKKLKESEKDTISMKIGNHETAIKTAQNNLLNYEKVSKVLKDEEIIDNNYKLFLDIFGKYGIGKMVLNRMLPLINEKISDLISEYCDFDIDLRLNDGDVNFLIIDKETEVEKELCTGSGFERSMGSLGIRCVLSEFCSLPKPNIIIFDEITGTADVDINLPKIGELFKKLINDGHYDHIWLISHLKDVQSWADNYIMVEKIDKISQIISQ